MLEQLITYKGITDRVSDTAFTTPSSYDSNNETSIQFRHSLKKVSSFVKQHFLPPGLHLSVTKPNTSLELTIRTKHNIRNLRPCITQHYRGPLAYIMAYALSGEHSYLRSVQSTNTLKIIKASKQCGVLLGVRKPRKPCRMAKFRRHRNITR